ncbi:MAG TPA: sugar ABC transporter ATP-binding protein [Armatimonadota bacterium]|jgi:ABC-type sugar transport system ATPase subunit
MNEAVGALLEMREIGKSFAGVPVLAGVHFDLRPGEVHVLAGENGAGKSTLIKILAGVHTADAGQMLLGGRRAQFKSPHDAARHGIAAIHQEMSLVGTMSVLDNIFLGREQVRAGCWNDFAAQRRQATELLAQLGLQGLDLAQPVEYYPIAVQQMIEIAKALTFDTRIIIMDEPTSTLTEPEAERLFALIATLKARGCGIIYISHKIEEIYRLGDRITVLRDGAYIGTAALTELPRAELIRWMVGREITQQFPPRTPEHGTERMRVAHFTVPNPVRGLPPLVDDVSFTVHAGEILGLAGLSGSGASELLRGLFGGYGRRPGGAITINGTSVALRSPRAALRQGLALLTNDRKTSGLVPAMGVGQNITLARLDAFSPGGWLRLREEYAAGLRQMRALQVKTQGWAQEISELSGGNQQKALLARWLLTEPAVLLLDEPTRGVDVGAKQEIYTLMNAWTAAGCALVLITSEMPELLAMADRILVLHRGRVRGEFTREEATQERVLRAAMGSREEYA